MARLICLFPQRRCGAHRHLHWNRRHAGRPGSRGQGGRVRLRRQAQAAEMPHGASGGTFQLLKIRLTFGLGLKSFGDSSKDSKEI